MSPLALMLHLDQISQVSLSLERPPLSTITVPILFLSSSLSPCLSPPPTLEILVSLIGATAMFLTPE